MKTQDLINGEDIFDLHLQFTEIIFSIKIIFIITTSLSFSLTKRFIKGMILGQKAVIQIHCDSFWLTFLTPQPFNRKRPFRKKQIKYAQVGQKTNAVFKYLVILW